MLAPIVFLILMVPVAPQLLPNNSIDRNTLPSAFNKVMPQTVASLKNLATTLKDVCKNFTQTLPRPANTVKFFLYTKSNPGGIQLRTGDLDGLRKTTFNPEWVTYILIHGAFETHSTPDCIFPRSSVRLILELELPINVIIMDYSGVTGYLLYYPATNVGLLESRDQGAAFIEYLHKNNLADVSKMKLVAYSLGCQVAGIVAAAVNQSINKPIGEIMAIDPTGIGFYPDACSQHQLSTFDATYVQAIYTDSNIPGFGIAHSVAHANFYINGGRNQPFCVDSLCRHLAAPFIWEKTLYSKDLVCASNRSDARHFSAYEDCCDGLYPMGENNKGTVFGDYCVKYTIPMILEPVSRALKKCLNVNSLSSGISWILELLT